MVDTVKDGNAGYYVNISLEDGALAAAFVAYTSPYGGAGGNTVQGIAASGTTTAANPIVNGGRYNAALPTYTNGQIAEAQYTTKGAAIVTLYSTAGAVLPAFGVTADAIANAATTFGVVNFGVVYNGASWDRARGDTVSAYSRLPPRTKTDRSLVTSTASAQIAAANAARSRIIIKNNDAAISVFVNFGAVATTGLGSMEIAPKAMLDLSGTTDAINVIAASGTPGVTAWEF